MFLFNERDAPLLSRIFVQQIKKKRKTKVRMKKVVCIVNKFDYKIVRKIRGREID